MWSGDKSGTSVNEGVVEARLDGRGNAIQNCPWHIAPSGVFTMSPAYMYYVCLLDHVPCLPVLSLLVHPWWKQ